MLSVCFAGEQGRADHAGSQAVARQDSGSTDTQLLQGTNSCDKWQVNYFN